MNEININIEGYNVNGICVGCLNFNRKMFYLEEAKHCFKILGNIDVPDELTIQVCWECSAAVRAVCRFQTQILNSYEVLINYSRQHTFLNSPSDLTKYATQRLSITRIPTSVKQDDEESPLNDVDEVQTGADDMKPEIDDIKIENNELDEQILIEIPKDPDSDSSQHVPEPLPISPFKDEVQDMSSDEDVQLSQLKKKKVKKDRSKNERKERGKTKKEKDQQLKTYRKLKNLPEHMVELHTMDEQEMWTVRQQDVENKEFAKLKYSCDKCIIGFNSEKLMKDHKLGKHQPKSESSHQCDVCQSYILTADNVSVHRALHLVAYCCKLCEYKTTLKRLMATHVTLHVEKTDSFNFACHICKKEFSTKSKLSYHKSVCKREKPQCDCCGKVFANKVTLKYHLNFRVNPTPEKPKENIRIPCKGCDKVFYSKKSYRAHVVIHDGLEYPCPVCGKLFQWKRNLARHLRNHAEREAGAKHECRQCGKRFSSRDCLSNHMRFSKRHVSEEAFVHECHYCGKKFATKWCMIDHVDWDHLKKIKYQCSVCLKAFKTAKIMVAHMNNIHEGKKNKEPDGEHLCDICGKSYKTVKRLKGHVWAMHTHRSTVKSYKCRLCPATFTWQTSIYKHMKCMHVNPKRGAKQQRLSQPKAEPYGGLELNNRMQYFPTNIVNNVVQNIVQQNVPTVGIVQDLV